MIGSDTLVLIALALATIALLAAVVGNIALRKRMDFTPDRGRNSTSQLNNDMAALKREVAMLGDTVERFRAQSLAGISESIAEKGTIIKADLSHELHRELEVVTDEFDKALSSIVERLDQKQEELSVRIDNYSSAASSLPEQPAPVELPPPNQPPPLPAPPPDPRINSLIAASVIDRFLSSLEDGQDKRKCLLASLDSVQDTAVLAKLAVAYPSTNSWLILKELVDRGVVSDIAGWALVSGAALTAAAGQHQQAEEFYQAARLSFSAAGGVNHEGLYVIAHSLARLLSQGDRAPLADMLKQEAETHLRFLMETKPTAMALPAVQLAEFYINEERYEAASILFRQIIDLASQVFPDAIYNGESAGRLWQGLAFSLSRLVNKTEPRELFLFIGDETIAFLEKALAAKMPLSDSERQAMQLCLLRLCERDKDSDAALTVAKSLLDDGVRLAVDSENKERFNFVAGEILGTVDELQLSRKKDGMPLLKRLVGIFMAVNNHNKAASAGAKLVDATLDLFGDASLETVAPINALADVYKAMGRYDLAEECYRQILEIQYKVYPTEHEEMVDVLLNLAQVCKLQKDVGEAEIFLESAMEMCTHVFDVTGESSSNSSSSSNSDSNSDSESKPGAEDMEESQRRRKALMDRAEALKGQLSHAL